MSVFRLPDLGEGLQEAEIVAWSVGPGDHVVAEQPLLSVETDKAVVEIPSPRAGRIAKLHGKPGDIVPIGAPLVEFEGGESTDTGTVVGELETGDPEGATAQAAGARRRPECGWRQRCADWPRSWASISPRYDRPGPKAR